MNKTSQKITSFAFILLQILLISISPSYRDFLIIFLFLFVVGINLYILVLPTSMNTKYDFLVLVPLCGVLVIAIVGAYFIGFSINIRYLAPTLLICSFLALPITYQLQKQSFLTILTDIRQSMRVVIIWATLIATPLVSLLLLPETFSHYLTSFIRCGPDLASYGKLTQYLLDGGTWSEALKQRIFFEHMSTNDIGTYADGTMSWSFVYHFRWGLAAYQALISIITFTHSAYQTAFLSMAVLHFLLSAIILLWLKNIMRLSAYIAVMGAIAFSLNANILNTWFEGFYGNEIALLFFAAILYVFLKLREINFPTCTDIVKFGSFFTLLFMANLLSYAESIVFILPSLIIVLFAVELFRGKKIQWITFFTFFGSLILALIFVLPCNFIFDWLNISYRVLSEQGGAGYAQPYWAYPNEIIGLGNIYLARLFHISHVCSYLQEIRTQFNIAWSLLLSGLLVIAASLYLYRRRINDNSIYIAGILMAVASYFSATYYFSHNYTYMKMYVFLLPILFTFSWSSLSELTKVHSVQFLFGKEKIIYFIAFTLIVVHGAIYIIQYSYNANAISEQKIALHQELAQLSFDDVFLYPMITQDNDTKLNASYNPKTFNDIITYQLYGAIVPTLWIIQIRWAAENWKYVQLYYKDHLYNKVFLFIEKTNAVSYKCTDKTIIFQNDHYLILDSGLLLYNALIPFQKPMGFDMFEHAADNCFVTKEPF